MRVWKHFSYTLSPNIEIYPQISKYPNIGNKGLKEWLLSCYFYQTLETVTVKPLPETAIIFYEKQTRAERTWIFFWLFHQSFGSLNVNFWATDEGQVSLTNVQKCECMISTKKSLESYHFSTWWLPFSRINMVINFCEINLSSLLLLENSLPIITKPSYHYDYVKDYSKIYSVYSLL